MMSSGYSPRSPPWWLCQKNMQKEVPRGHPNQTAEPPQLAPVDTKNQWLNCEVFDVSKLLVLSVSLSPTMQRPAMVTNFSCLYLRPHFFEHYPDLCP